ncbi:hypothetical protein [Paenibacillus elgii]|uniref:hypothetical protein n=1 Tax=Paenibacillus elgii TaxID=189691 RepID=UPI0020425473|nr:hypothetical protein [Paenibacillus elgii]MCM3271147.1 hypothetical protein [Paenibacillus elgii]
MEDFAILINQNGSKLAFDVCVKGELYRVIYKYDYVNIIERIVDGKLESIPDPASLPNFDRICELVEEKARGMDDFEG